MDVTNPPTDIALYAAFFSRAILAFRVKDVLLKYAPALLSAEKLRIPLHILHGTGIDIATEGRQLSSRPPRGNSPFLKACFRKPANKTRKNDMDAQTLEALNKSIAHWEEMAENGSFNAQPTPGQCALCRLFRFKDSMFSMECGECPVAKSGHHLCKNTPFTSAEDAYEDNNESAFRFYASREVEFLKSLLPKTAEHPRNEAETLQP